MIEALLADVDTLCRVSYEANCHLMLHIHNAHRTAIGLCDMGYAQVVVYSSFLNI